MSEFTLSLIVYGALQLASLAMLPRWWKLAALPAFYPLPAVCDVFQTGGGYMGDVLVAILLIFVCAYLLAVWAVFGLTRLAMGVRSPIAIDTTNHAGPEPRFAPLEGVIDGMHYQADSLSYGNVEVWIDLPQEEMRLPQIFVETRSAPFDPSRAEWGAEEIQALFDLGAEDVDVGFHSDCIQVVFPQDRVVVTRELAEKAATLMVALRRQALETSGRN